MWYNGKYNALRKRGENSKGWKDEKNGNPSLCTVFSKARYDQGYYCKVWKWGTSW